MADYLLLDDGTSRFLLDEGYADENFSFLLLDTYSHYSSTSSYTSPGTHSFTWPPRVPFVLVDCTGAGAGAVWDHCGAARHGGGGGGFVRAKIFRQVHRDTDVLVVGAGGDPEPDENTHSVGGTSYFRRGAKIQATGGNRMNGGSGSTTETLIAAYNGGNGCLAEFDDYCQTITRGCGGEPGTINGNGANGTCVSGSYSCSSGSNDPGRGGHGNESGLDGKVIVSVPQQDSPFSLYFSSLPSSIYHSQEIKPFVEVILIDAEFGFYVLDSGSTSCTVTITLETNPHGATLSGTTSKAFSSLFEAWLFTDLSIDTSGSGYRFQAEASACSNAPSSALSDFFNVLEDITLYSINLFQLAGKQSAHIDRVIESTKESTSSTFTIPRVQCLLSAFEQGLRIDLVPQQSVVNIISTNSASKTEALSEALSTNYCSTGSVDLPINYELGEETNFSKLITNFCLESTIRKTVFLASSLAQNALFLESSLTPGLGSSPYLNFVYDQEMNMYFPLLTLQFTLSCSNLPVNTLEKLFLELAVDLEGAREISFSTTYQQTVANCKPNSELADFALPIELSKTIQVTYIPSSIEHAFTASFNRARVLTPIDNLLYSTTFPSCTAASAVGVKINFVDSESDLFSINSYLSFVSRLFSAQLGAEVSSMSVDTYTQYSTYSSGPLQKFSVVSSIENIVQEISRAVSTPGNKTGFWNVDTFSSVVQASPHLDVSCHFGSLDSDSICLWSTAKSPLSQNDRFETVIQQIASPLAASLTAYDSVRTWLFSTTVSTVPASVSLKPSVWSLDTTATASLHLSFNTAASGFSAFSSVSRNSLSGSNICYPFSEATLLQSVPISTLYSASTYFDGSIFSFNKPRLLSPTTNIWSYPVANVGTKTKVDGTVSYETGFTGLSVEVPQELDSFTVARSISFSTHEAAYYNVLNSKIIHSPFSERTVPANRSFLYNIEPGLVQIFELQGSNSTINISTHTISCENPNFALVSVSGLASTGIFNFCDLSTCISETALASKLVSSILISTRGVNAQNLFPCEFSDLEIPYLSLTTATVTANLFLAFITPQRLTHITTQNFNSYFIHPNSATWFIHTTTSLYLPEITSTYLRPEISSVAYVNHFIPISSSFFGTNEVFVPVSIETENIEFSVTYSHSYPSIESSTETIKSYISTTYGSNFLSTLVNKLRTYDLEFASSTVDPSSYLVGLSNLGIQPDHVSTGSPDVRVNTGTSFDTSAEYGGGSALLVVFPSSLDITSSPNRSTSPITRTRIISSATAAASGLSGWTVFASTHTNSREYKDLQYSVFVSTDVRLLHSELSPSSLGKQTSSTKAAFRSVDSTAARIHSPIVSILFVTSTDLSLAYHDIATAVFDVFCMLEASTIAVDGQATAITYSTEIQWVPVIVDVIGPTLPTSQDSQAYLVRLTANPIMLVM